MIAIKKGKETLYEILNVSENATLLEIKKAYREMVRLYHPDKVAGKNDSELKNRAGKIMIKLNNAKEILLDPFKRSEYDLKLRKLKSDEILTNRGDSEHIEVTELLEIEWDPDTVSLNPETRGESPIPQPTLATEMFHTPPPQRSPPRGPDFNEFRTRHLTFCPVCTNENIYGGIICSNCGGILVEPGLAQRLGASLAAKGYPIVYRPTQVENPFYKNLQYPCIIISQPVIQLSESNLSETRPNDYIENARKFSNTAQQGNSANSATIKPPITQRYLFFCPNCGTENLKGYENCEVCSTSLLDNQRSITPSNSSDYTGSQVDHQILTPQSCHYCGQKIEDPNQAYCYYCGNLFYSY